MTNFMQRSGKHFLTIKAARELIKEIEKAGVDDLRTLADSGKSIVETYLNGCSSEEKARIRQDGNFLLQMGVTPDMILAEVARQMPELAPIMEGRDSYRESEIARLTSFLRSG